jgi:hypothetical protein
LLSASSWHFNRTCRDPIPEWVVLLDFLNRSCWIARASITRARIDPDGSPLGVAADSSRKSTNGTSMCKSIRSGKVRASMLRSYFLFSYIQSLTP